MRVVTLVVKCFLEAHLSGRFGLMLTMLVSESGLVATARLHSSSSSSSVRVIDTLCGFAFIACHIVISPPLLPLCVWRCIYIIIFVLRQQRTHHMNKKSAHKI